MGDALRTTSIEADTRAIEAADAAASAATDGAVLCAGERDQARAAVDAVLGVAAPSIRRDALGEAIAVVEALRDAIPPPSALGVLRGLRDTQAPT